MSTADAADIAFFVNDKAERSRKLIVNTVAASACVDKGPYALRRQIGFPVAIHGSSEADIDHERWPKFGQEVGRELAALPFLKARLGQRYGPE